MRYNGGISAAYRSAEFNNGGIFCMTDKSTETYGVARLTVEQIPQMAAVLARAFQDDPLQHYLFPAAAERARLMPALFRVALHHGLRAGEVWTTAGATLGLAAWEPLGWAEITHDQVEQADPNELPSAIGTAAFERLTSFVAYLGALHRRDVPGRHWYLSCLGVDPARQSQGLGGSLLQPILARAAAEGVPCYLETAQPRAVPFYRKHGFEVIVEDSEPTSGVRIWTFRCD
jgi:ribosomal protein S18 acetylase RimI-like enzyme